MLLCVGGVLYCTVLYWLCAGGVLYCTVLYCTGCVQVVYPEDRWRLPSAEEMETVPSQQRECLARDQVFWPPTRYPEMGIIA